ncbi:MAG: aromatic ring-hydroxylating dioxygenase subunit alpha [Caulobacterales bacterium]
MNEHRKIPRVHLDRRLDETVRIGPSYQEIVRKDLVQPPADLLEHHLYPEECRPIDRERFFSPQFQRLEVEKMWSRVWQFACREDELPAAGDTVVYELGDMSILLIRGRDNVIRAFHNTCLHRGTKLCHADTRLAEVRCPFHGFTWSLEGDLTDVPSRWDFPFIDDKKFRLHEVRVELWGGIVFINLDRNAPPLKDYLEVLPEHFIGCSDYSQKYVKAHYRKRLECNWKAAIEAFIENYHSLETHPQTVCFNADDNTQYDVFPGARHVSRFLIPNGAQSPHIEKTLSEQEIFASLFEFMAPGSQPPPLPEGMSARHYLAELSRGAAHQATQRDYSTCSDIEALDPMQYLLFPNIIIFRGLGIPLIYRFKPVGNDPDACTFEMYVMEDLPANGARPEPPEVEDFGDQSFRQAAHALPAWLREVYDQDTQNLAMQQLGLKAGGPKDVWYSRQHESRNRHFHDTLDDYLSR